MLQIYINTRGTKYFTQNSAIYDTQLKIANLIILNNFLNCEQLLFLLTTVQT